MRTVLIAALIAFAATSATAQQQPPPPTCNGPEYRAFDFWVGEWDAYVTGTENLAGRSTIAREDASCVITEHWRSTRQPYTGRSLNIYDRGSHKWEQFWVDSTGGLTHFIGGPEANGMRLVAEQTPGPQQTRYTRMTFTPNADGSVRQFGENSSDGQTWTAAFDFTYKHHTGA